MYEKSIQEEQRYQGLPTVWNGVADGELVSNSLESNGNRKIPYQDDSLFGRSYEDNRDDIIGNLRFDDLSQQENNQRENSERLMEKQPVKEKAKNQISDDEWLMSLQFNFNQRLNNGNNESDPKNQTSDDQGSGLIFQPININQRLNNGNNESHPQREDVQTNPQFIYGTIDQKKSNVRKVIVKLYTQMDGSFAQDLNLSIRKIEGLPQRYREKIPQKTFNKKNLDIFLNQKQYPGEVDWGYVLDVNSIKFSENFGLPPNMSELGITFSKEQLEKLIELCKEIRKLHFESMIRLFRYKETGLIQKIQKWFDRQFYLELRNLDQSTEYRGLLNYCIRNLPTQRPTNRRYQRHIRRTGQIVN